jgi:DNA mismatch repair ATPase MutS
MKAHLLFPDTDLDLTAKLPDQAEDLRRDLGIDTLINAMAGEDKLIAQVAEHVLFTPLTDPALIAYRQQVLADALANRETVERLYELSLAAIQADKQIWKPFGLHPDSVLHRSVQILQAFAKLLRDLRAMADTPDGAFTSPGFLALFAMLRNQLDEAYFTQVEAHLRRLRFKDGVLLSADLGTGLRGTGYTLRVSENDRLGWLGRLTADRPPSVAFTVPDRDEAGHQALGELRGRGAALAANALARSADNILDFFTMLRVELAFYLGAIRLNETFTAREVALCTPRVLPAGTGSWSFARLIDPNLALGRPGALVGNDAGPAARPLVMITGANQGGKSPLLRAIGLAQVMGQCGLFACARACTVPAATGIFSHYKREEDAAMTSGKLNEELLRMARIARSVKPGGLVLFNESFAATNEREGSQISRQVIEALIDSGVRVVCVTHLFDLARSLYTEDGERALFLRAERREDTVRTFRLVEGEPLPTSFGQDLYRQVFHDRRQPAAARAGRAA